MNVYANVYADSYFYNHNWRNRYDTNPMLLDFPKSVFLLQTRLLQQRIFIQTWNLISQAL